MEKRVEEQLGIIQSRQGWKIIHFPEVFLLLKLNLSMFLPY